MNLKYVPLSAPTMLDSEKGPEGELKEMIGKSGMIKKMMTIINHNNNQINNYDDDSNNNSTNKKIQRRMYQ